jgi:predicted kinase
MKELIIIRGLPGSGKSTFAKILGGEHIETDMFFVKQGEYKFDPTMLGLAHAWCQTKVRNLMFSDTSRIVVSNTFTQEWEMKPYYDLAKTYNYRVISIIVENRHNGVNEHNVPEETLIKMKNRFEIKL